MRGFLLASVGVISLAGAAVADEQIDKAKEVIAQRLKDPESARFTNLSLSKDGNVVCGHVNAKNSFGGYAGPQRFRYYINDSRAVIVDMGGISTAYLDSMAQPIEAVCP